MSADDFNAQLLSQLECPVCLETCLPPIYMCRNGHIVCAKCQPKLTECSTCRAPGKPVLRCVQFEKMAALLKLPCKNEPRGCNLTFNMDELAKHLPKCDHGFQCNLCIAFKGSSQELNNHFLSKHTQYYLRISSAGSSSFTTVLPTNKDLHNRTCYNLCFFNDDIFWLESKYTSATRILTRTLRIVSHEAKDASRYYSSVEFKIKGNQSEYKVFNQADVPLFTDDSANGIMEIFLPACIVDSFEDGKISYTSQISLKK